MRIEDNRTFKSIYQIGNVIKNKQNYYLVISGMDEQYELLNLKNNSVVGSADSFEKFANLAYSRDDELITNAKIVIK